MCKCRAQGHGRWEGGLEEEEEEEEEGEEEEKEEEEEEARSKDPWPLTE